MSEGYDVMLNRLDALDLTASKVCFLVSDFTNLPPPPPRHQDLVKGNLLHETLLQERSVDYDHMEAERMMALIKHGNIALGVTWAGAKCVFDLFSKLTREDCLTKWNLSVDPAWFDSNTKNATSFTLKTSPIPMAWIVQNIIVPQTIQLQESLLFLLFGLTYASFPMVGEATFFHSYTWSEGFMDTFQTLEESLSSDVERWCSFIWWDIFCQNQHIKGDVGKTFQTVIHQANTVLFSLPHLMKPIALGRVWCLFELTHALLNQPKVELKIINHSRKNHKSVGEPDDYIVDVNNANAYFMEDKVMLLALMEKDIEGGCEGANTAIQNLFFPCFLRQCLLEQVEEGNLMVIKSIVQKHAIRVSDATRYDGTTLLHIAAKHGHLDVSRYLLDEQVDSNAINYLDRTALHDASKNGHAEICELLLQTGASVDMQDDDGETALHMAQNIEVVQVLLLYNADPTIENKYDDFIPRFSLMMENKPAEMIAALKEAEMKWDDGECEETSSGNDSDSGSDDGDNDGDGGSDGGDSNSDDGDSASDGGDGDSDDDSGSDGGDSGSNDDDCDSDDGDSDSESKDGDGNDCDIGDMTTIIHSGSTYSA
jgi:ankyrin repeat protein